MLRVKIELVPFGDEARATTLHVMELWNDGGKRNDTHGNYKGRTFPKGVSKGTVIRSGEVKNFPRLRKNAWYLLAQMLKNMGYA